MVLWGCVCMYGLTLEVVVDLNQLDSHVFTCTQHNQCLVSDCLNACTHTHVQLTPQHLLYQRWVSAICKYLQNVRSRDCHVTHTPTSLQHTHAAAPN